MKKAIRFLVPLLLLILIIGSIFWYLFIYDRDFTRDTLLSQARFQDLHGNSRISSWCYNMAYKFSGHDQNVAIELANQYKSAGNYTKAEYTLTGAINSAPTAELYAALCKTYVEQDKLLDAVNMLDNISDPAIRSVLEANRPSTPVPDSEAGYYSQYIDLHLSADGTIYYTTDGDFPSTAGPRYDEGIPLDAGETTVYAISVGDNGLVSPVAVLGYTITGVIEEVTFTDPTLEAAIRELVHVDAAKPVYTNQLWEITEFTAPEGVADYTDLALLPNLKSLTIQNQQLTTLSPIASLGWLETLDLTGCKFPSEDLSCLASLTRLTSLTLSDCSLSTVAGLAGAQSLTHLDLSNNTVRNLDALAPMATLVELDLKHNAVTDLSSLSNLMNLETLDVSFNALTSLSPLSSCIKLKWLGADNNQINSLKGVENLTLLTYLSVDYNNLTDVSVLSGSTELTNLSIASNTISDITCLSGLTKLVIFDFSGNQIAELPDWPEGCPMQTIDGSYNALTDINVLSKMQSLTHVYMDYNLLTNVDALADNYCLVQVNVYGNQIEDVSALREHDIIVNYDPTYHSED
ncbi:MAG: leucine-rich repeat domain-containing protein [Faecousia sp.]